MFKIIISALIILISFTTKSFASQDIIANCSPKLRSSLEIIQQLPEARKLIEEIQREGNISIQDGYMAPSSQFGACWDPNRRIIFVNPSSTRSKGSLIASLIFELHNAAINSKLNQLDYLASKGRISKKAYIEAVEHLEYQNSLKASKLAGKGIAMGLFPPEAQLPTFPNFKEHFRVQQMGGHSAFIARNYDQLTQCYFY